MVPFHVLDPVEYFDHKFGIVKLLIVNEDVKVKCCEDPLCGPCTWLFNYTLKCTSNDRLFVYLLYDHPRPHLASKYGCHLNEVHTTFCDDSEDCPNQVKTIKQGQIFLISSSVINELPSSFTSICEVFRSIVQVNQVWPGCDDKPKKVVPHWKKQPPPNH